MGEGKGKKDMKRIAIIATTLLAAALMAAALVGCSGQSSSTSASSASASGSASASASESASASAPASASASAAASESASASSAAGESQDPVVAELKDAIANTPTYKSVTLTEVDKAITKLGAEAVEGASGEAASSESAAAESAASESASSESAAPEEASSDDVLESITVYKFDASGDKLKTDMVGEIEDIKIRYVSDGDAAVCVTDGPVYSGTTEQFGLSHFAGIEAYLTDKAGDLNTLIDCASTVTKEQEGDLTVYTLTLDPEKYMASDEILTMMKEYGDPVVSAVFTLSFDKEGRLISTHEVVEYEKSIADSTYTLSDFDSTVVEAMPAADKTYEEMEADIEEKYKALEEELDATSEYQDASASSSAAAAN